MARALRIEAAGLSYHVWARGTGGMAIYRDDHDRTHFLGLLERSCIRYDVDCHAFCLMPNHYHVVITTHEPNLSRAIQLVNFRYAQWWNHRHDRPGHVFQGRFGAQIIQDDTYLLTVCRYVVLNPVRAGLVISPEHWRWSSYRGTAGIEAAPSFLCPDTLWGLLGTRDGKTAARRYREFVTRTESSCQELSSNPVLGDPNFVEQFKGRRAEASSEVPLRERRSRRPVQDFFADTFTATDRAAAARAAQQAGYSLVEIGTFLGVHYSTVSKMVSPSRRGSEP